MALQDALGTVGDPITRAISSTFGKSNETMPTLSPEQGMQRRIARGAMAEEQLPGLLEGSMAEATKAQEDIAKQRTGMAERGRAIGEEFAVKERELIEAPEYKQKEIPAFEPSSANLEDIRNVLGLSIVAGFLTGGASKRSGMAAMAALNGAVEGFRQGRQDVYKREIDVFAKNVEAIKENNKQTLERFNKAMGLLQTDRKAAEGELKVLEAELQNSVAGAALRQGMYKQAQDAFFKAVEGSDAASKTLLEMKKAQEDRAARAAEREMRLRDFKVIGQDEEGNVIMANDLGQTRTMEGVRAAGGARVTQQQSIAQRAVNSLGGVASALESIKELPAGTTTGLLPNLTTKDGMINYVRNTMGRKISSRDAEMMNTLFTGIGRNLASIESSGIATGLVELARQMQSGTYINSGVDDPYKVAIKLADIRRIATENIRPAIESGLMPKQQAQTAMALVKRIEEAVPFDTIDVVRAANAKGRPTIGQRTTEAVTNQPAAPSGTPTIPQQSAKPMPNETKLKAYADANFQGDIEAARSFLSSQGYK